MGPNHIHYARARSAKVGPAYYIQSRLTDVNRYALLIERRKNTNIMMHNFILLVFVQHSDLT